jgi:hypothetical protein
MKALEQAAMNGCGGFAVKLLVDDALDQRFKRRLGAGDAQGKWACALDEAAEFWIGGGKLFTGESGVVAGRTRAVEWTRHQMTVSQTTKKVFGCPIATRTVLVLIYKADTFLAG